MYLLGVCDGHGRHGHHISQYIHDTYIEIFRQEMKGVNWGDTKAIKNRLSHSVLLLDQAL